MTIYLCLYNGADKPHGGSRDNGPVGPIFKVEDLKLQIDANSYIVWSAGSLRIVNCCVYYDNLFYSCWELQTRILMADEYRLCQMNHAKATPVPFEHVIATERELYWLRTMDRFAMIRKQLNDEQERSASRRPVRIRGTQ